MKKMHFILLPLTGKNSSESNAKPEKEYGVHQTNPTGIQEDNCQQIQRMGNISSVTSPQKKRDRTIITTQE